LSSDELLELLNEIQLLSVWALALVLDAIYPVDELVSGLKFGTVKHVDEVDDEWTSWVLLRKQDVVL
jgi:hypothetical protein